MKKKQKINPPAGGQLQFFFRSKNLRNTAKKIAIRTVSPESAALLPTYALKKKLSIKVLTYD